MRRCLGTYLTILVLCAGAAASQAAARAQAADRVALENKRVVLVRTGRLARQFPERRTAVVNYPFVKSFPDRAVLHKLRAMLLVQNIFETSLAQYRQDAWLTEFDYVVNYNKHHILDISFYQSGVGAYPDTHTRHFAISLKTGEMLRARDVFRAETLETLAGLVNARLRAEVKQISDEISRDTDIDADAKDAVKETLSELRFTVENLDEFMVDERGVTFMFDAGFPHVIEALEPEGDYLFSYAQLAPYIKRDGLLQRFVR
ncbi:MAG TPA: hypothetical protein VGV59_03190 [Pyrinomonadaceae bacterium]|nr:hypothetical protein [Pyrinomonadaceae bacterium]